jgi:hypothetical protein
MSYEAVCRRKGELIVGEHLPCRAVGFLRWGKRLRLTVINGLSSSDHSTDASSIGIVSAFCA